MKEREAMDFLRSQQNPDGSWKGWKPSPFPSMYCLRILEILDKKPLYKNTYTWVRSLQTDKRGFAETTGQNSWAYSTRCGAEMHRILKIEPKHKEIKDYILSHQNNDGGFGEMKNMGSNLLATCYWGLSALSLGFSIDKTIISFLKRELMNCNNLMLVYWSLKILSSMGSLPDISKEILRYNNFNNRYYSTMISKIMGWNIEKTDVFPLFASPEETYKSLELMKIKKSYFDKEKMLQYVREQELPAGGFFNNNETSMLRAAECITALKMLKSTPTKDSSIWVMKCKNDAFARSVGARPTINMQVRAMRILKLAGRTFESQSIVEYLEKAIFPISPFNAFYGMLAYAELGVVPKRYKEIIEGIINFHNTDGGFGSGESYMYATSRSVVAIGSIHEILKKHKIEHVSYIEKIRYKTIRWIKSCENKGGFGWMPGERSYMQPTFLALHALHVLDAKPEYTEEHIKWIERCQNDDGGFHGGDNKTPSGSVYTYYAIAGLGLLNGKYEKGLLGL